MLLDIAGSQGGPLQGVRPPSNHILQSQEHSNHFGGDGGVYFDSGGGSGSSGTQASSFSGGAGGGSGLAKWRDGAQFRGGGIAQGGEDPSLFRNSIEGIYTTPHLPVDQQQSPPRRGHHGHSQRHQQPTPTEQDQVTPKQVNTSM